MILVEGILVFLVIALFCGLGYAAGHNVWEPKKWLLIHIILCGASSAIVCGILSFFKTIG